MPCSSCKQVKEIPATSGLVYSLAPETRFVTDSRDNTYPISRSLITRPHSPKRGWNVVFWINGQAHPIKGGSPAHIFKSTKTLFDLNAVPYTEVALWFNLNLQWLERAIEKYQNVKYSDLIKLAQ